MFSENLKNPGIPQTDVPSGFKKLPLLVFLENTCYLNLRTDLEKSVKETYFCKVTGKPNDERKSNKRNHDLVHTVVGNNAGTDFLLLA